MENRLLTSRSLFVSSTGTALAFDDVGAADFNSVHGVLQQEEIGRIKPTRSSGMFTMVYCHWLLTKVSNAKWIDGYRCSRTLKLTIEERGSNVEGLHPRVRLNDQRNSNELAAVGEVVWVRSEMEQSMEAHFSTDQTLSIYLRLDLLLSLNVLKRCAWRRI